MSYLSVALECGDTCPRLLSFFFFSRRDKNPLCKRGLTSDLQEAHRHHRRQARVERRRSRGRGQSSVAGTVLDRIVGGAEPMVRAGRNWDRG